MRTSHEGRLLQRVCKPSVLFRAPGIHLSSLHLVKDKGLTPLSSFRPITPLLRHWYTYSQKEEEFLSCSDIGNPFPIRIDKEEHIV